MNQDKYFDKEILEMYLSDKPNPVVKMEIVNKSPLLYVSWDGKKEVLIPIIDEYGVPTGEFYVEEKIKSPDGHETVIRKYYRK